MKLVNPEDVRPPAVANMFYPGEPRVLEKNVQELLETSEPPAVSGHIVGLVCPHAGYMYSGRVAAYAYKLVAGRHYPVVAIISPSHREYFPGVSVFDGRGYLTPLGLVPVAADLAEKLIEQDDRIFSSWAGHTEEHALEVQLPFLQKVLTDFKIIPIVMGDQDAETCRMLGNVLATVLEGHSALIVASSDLSHYYPYDQAVRIDQGTERYVAQFDETGLMEALETRRSEACGGGPMVAAMIASKKLGAQESRILLYQNSGDVTGDHSRVVGYLSAAFVGLN